MSVRAYKVIEINCEKTPTFNLWHDEELVELLSVYSKDGLNIDGCGIIEFGEEDIKDALKEAKGEDTKEKLKVMLAQAKEKHGYVQYYCY